MLSIHLKGEQEIHLFDEAKYIKIHRVLAFNTSKLFSGIMSPIRCKIDSYLAL
jgi:hypothetical protein